MLSVKVLHLIKLAWSASLSALSIWIEVGLVLTVLSDAPLRKRHLYAAGELDCCLENHYVQPS